MALDPLNSSNLEKVALKGLKVTCERLEELNMRSALTLPELPSMDPPMITSQLIDSYSDSDLLAS